MPQGKRSPWSDADDTALIALWDKVASVALIAIMLKRSRSSVQTRASRLGLPPRIEDSDRHRRRWVDGDDEKLEEFLEELTEPNGGIPIVELSDRMGRSVDAVVSRLEALMGEDSDVMSRLVAPPTPELPSPGERPVLERSLSAEPKASRNSGKTKKCLKCRRNFWSSGNFNWVCITCKRSDDWDYD